MLRSIREVRVEARSRTGWIGAGRIGDGIGVTEPRLSDAAAAAAADGGEIGGAGKSTGGILQGETVCLYESGGWALQATRPQDARISIPSAGPVSIVSAILGSILSQSRQRCERHVSGPPGVIRPTILGLIVQSKYATMSVVPLLGAPLTQRRDHSLSKLSGSIKISECHLIRGIRVAIEREGASIVR